MSMKTERLQVLIETEQRERLERVAYPSGLEEKAAIATGILAAAPMDVPDPSDLRAELDLIRGRA